MVPVAWRSYPSATRDPGDLMSDLYTHTAYHCNSHRSIYPNIMRYDAVSWVLWRLQDLKDCLTSDITLGNHSIRVTSNYQNRQIWPLKYAWICYLPSNNAITRPENYLISFRHHFVTPQKFKIKRFSGYREKRERTDRQTHIEKYNIDI